MKIIRRNSDRIDITTWWWIEFLFKWCMKKKEFIERMWVIVRRNRLDLTCLTIEKKAYPKGRCSVFAMRFYLIRFSHKIKNDLWMEKKFRWKIVLCVKEYFLDRKMFENERMLCARKNTVPCVWKNVLSMEEYPGDGELPCGWSNALWVKHVFIIKASFHHQNILPLTKHVSTQRHSFIHRAYVMTNALNATKIEMRGQGVMNG